LKTNPQIQRDYKARMRADGYDMLSPWVFTGKPGTPQNDNKTKVKKYVDRLNKAALKGAGQ